MFDELQRTLARLSETKIAVPIPIDSEGYLDRECPSNACLFQFKVYQDDWRDKVRDEEVYCPFCRHSAAANQWLAREQINLVANAARETVGQQISSAMQRDADRWNQSQCPDSFLQITMKVSSRPQHFKLPASAAEPMRLRLTCPKCACRYAVIGSAFFCPACGHNAAEQTFTQSLDGITKSLDTLEDLRRVVLDRDAAESMARLIVEYGLQNAVTTFQRYAEALYGRCSQARIPRRNAFQNLREGSDLWHAATGKYYEDHLSLLEFAVLSRVFQQRHLLAHTQGLVDQDYIQRSCDTIYEVGQRLVVRQSDVRAAAALIEKLGAAMEIDISHPNCQLR